MRIFFMTTVCLPDSDPEWDTLIRKILDFAPDKIVLVSNMEAAIEMWNPLLEGLEKYCISKNAIIHFIVPHIYKIYKDKSHILQERSYGCLIPSWNILLNNTTAEQHIKWDLASFSAPFHKGFYHFYKLFSFYNWRPSNHRIAMLDSIAQHDLIKDGVITWHFDDPNIAWKHYSGKKMIDPKENYSKESNEHFRYPRTYNHSFFDLVGETQEEIHHLTEKTLRPIAYFKPFLVISSQGYHRNYLEKYIGLELYREIFDYRFDKKKHLQDRVDGIIENIIRLKNTTKSDQLSMYKDIRPKMIRNKNKLTELVYDKNRVVPKCLDFLKEPGHTVVVHAGDTFFDHLNEINFCDYRINNITLDEYLLSR